MWAKKRVRYTASIFGDEWKVEILSAKEYKSQFGNDSLAITLLEDKGIYFNREEYTRDILIHELAHAFLSYHALEDLDLDHDEWEEVYCTLMAKHLDKIVAVVNKIDGGRKCKSSLE